MLGRTFAAQALRRTVHAVALGAVTLAAGCVEEPKRAPAPAAGAVIAAPSIAGIYDCAEDGRIQVEYAGSGVRVTESDGTVLDLPASPAGQMTRFGEGTSAIVIEGREALYMRARREPWTCVR